MVLWVKGTTSLGGTTVQTYANQATKAWRLIWDHRDQHSHRSPTLNPWSLEFTLAWVTLLYVVSQQGCPVKNVKTSGAATVDICWLWLVTAELFSIVQTRPQKLPSPSSHHSFQTLNPSQIPQHSKRVMLRYRLDQQTNGTSLGLKKPLHHRNCIAPERLHLCARSCNIDWRPNHPSETQSDRQHLYP